jgi:hypothetical protein
MGLPSEEAHPAETPQFEEFSAYQDRPPAEPRVDDFSAEIEEFINIMEAAQSESSHVVEKVTYYDKAVYENLSMVIHEEEEALFNTVPDVVRVRAAADTGAVDNVIGPASLPRGAVPSGNKDGKHFCGAGGDTIERYGSVDTLIESIYGEMACEWQVADVTRALHSISKVTAPKELEQGYHEVLFTNKKGVVVPPGFVEQILKLVKPILEYEREGGLYLADLAVSSFTRQGQKK